MPDYGPFETEDQARMIPAVRAVWETLRTSPRRMDELNLAMLDEACAASGIDAGQYGHRILAWLANMEPQTCVVFADLIIRAHEAGKAAGPDGSVTAWGLRYESDDGDDVVMPYSEGEVRQILREDGDPGPGTRRTVVTRLVGPWKEAPDV